MRNYLITFTLTILCSSNAYSLIGFEEAVFPELITSSRALAMGNAFICKVDDSASAFYNPAGLGTVRHGHFHLMNFQLETNKGLMDMSAGGRFTDAAKNIGKGFSLDGTRQLLVKTENRGTLAHARLQSMPNILFRYFTLGFLAKKHVRSTIGEGATDLFEYATRTDYGPYAAMNISLFGGIIKFGATGVILNRNEAIGELPNDQTVDLQDSDYKKGTMAYVIAGGRITLPMTFLPTFAGVVHNAGGNEFGNARGGGKPTKIKQQIDVGFSITPQFSKRARIHLEANYKDIGSAYSDISTTRKIVFGAEIDIKRTFFMRFGYGDGFGSGGLGIRSRKLEFDLTTYAVDTTSSKFRGQEDRRFVLSLSSGF